MILYGNRFCLPSSINFLFATHPCKDEIFFNGLNALVYSDNLNFTKTYVLLIFKTMVLERFKFDLHLEFGWKHSLF